MVQVSLSTSTNFDGDLNALVEDQGNALTVRFDLDEPAPAGGLKVYIDSDIEQILNRLDLPAAIANPQTENLNLFATQTNFDNSGLAVEITAGSTFATVTLDIFDNPEPDTFLPETFDGLVEATFSLLTADQIAPEDQSSITGVGDYTVAPDGASSTVLFADEVSQLPTGPEPPASSGGYDEAVSGDIFDDPSNPIDLELTEGTTRLSASTGGGDQEYVTVTVPEGFQLDSLDVEAYNESDVAFIGVQEGTTFTEPLDNSADTGNILGYALFGQGETSTDILDDIGNGAGAIGFDSPLPAGTYTFGLQQLQGPSDYTLAFNVSAASTMPPSGDLPIVSFEAIPATISEEGTAEERLLRLVFTVEGTIPEGGLVVNFDNLFGITDQMDGEDDRGAFNNLGFAGFDIPNNRILVRLDANEASLELPIINDLVEETTTFDFRLAEGEGYVVDPAQNSTLFTITDDNGGPGVGPTIGLSVSETNLAEGDPLTVSFTVDGDIPAGGVDVLVESSAARALGQFELSDLSALELVGISNLRPGDTTGRSFIATLTEPNASITLTIFDDIVAEDALEVPFTLINGEPYEVDPAAAEVTLTISDDVQAVGPTVGISLDKSSVVEGETITLSFNVEGEIPTEGLTVLVNDNEGIRSLTEFDVFNAELSEGIADFPTPADGDSGFFITLTQPTASITLPVLDDGADEDEADEVFTFEVIDGEAYEVAPDASSVTLSIADAADSGLSVSLDVLAGTFTTDENGIDSIITPNLLLDGSGVPILSLLLSADGPVPEAGLVVNVQSDASDLTEFIQGSNFVPTTFGGQVLEAIYDEAGNPTGLQVRLDNRNTVVTFNTGFATPTDGTSPIGLNFSLAAGEGYTPIETTATATIYPDASELPTPPEPVEVSIGFTSDIGVLTEGGDTGTLNFTVEGDIPPEGVIIFVSNNQFAGIVDFDLLNATATGGSFPAPDGNAGGFFFKITEPNASITFQAREDEEIEGLEQVDVALQPQPGYTIADGASEVAVLIQESDESQIQVSLETSPDILVEEEGTVSVHTFTLSAPPPAEGITVTVATPGLADFDPAGIATTGIAGDIQVLESAPEQLLFTIAEQTATISLPVANDGVTEGLETATFTLLAGAGYQIAPDAAAGTFTIVDTADQVPLVVEDDESNDTIATAVATGLSPDNNAVSIDGRIRGNFFDSDLSLRTDLAEDVDLYSFELAAGDTVRIDTDSAVFDSGLDTLLRLFDASGEQLTQSDDDFAPDELFAPGRRDSYLEYTATKAGTYYVGLSSFGNGIFNFFQDEQGNPTNAPYDPNVAASGTGRSFGDYTLNLKLNEEFTAAATEIPAGTGEGPTVSLSATPGTYDGDDNLLANALVQFVDDDSASLLTLGLDVEGDIPETGIEVFITSNIDLSTVFSSSAPFSPGGAEVLGAVYNETGAPVGLRVNMTSNTTILNLNLDSPDVAPTDGVEDVTFTVEPAAGYTVGGGAFSTPIYDTLADVPALPTVPTVSVSVSETALVESTGNTTTLTFELDAPPPAGGVVVNMDSGIRAALGEFNVFDAEIVGGSFPSPNFQASGFFFNITEQTATITLSAFDETTNPDIPAEDALEGIEEFTFTVQPGVGYAIAPDAGAVTLTIADNPDSVPLPGDGDGDGDGDGEEPTTPVETEFNDTIAEANPLAVPADGSTVVIKAEIGTTRQTRNLVDRSEDVDIYSFNLEAGQTIILDVDGGGTGDAGVAGSLLDNILRIFDAEGTELAIVENAGAPDEVFQANGDAYIEFTAPETGTYYAGISNLGNNFYDPNVVGSGSGWTFIDAFEPGPYRLEARLADSQPGDGPVVSLAIEPDQVAETDDDRVVNISFNVDGEIPETGLSILYQADVDGFFSRVEGAPDTTTLAPGPFVDAENNIFELVLFDNNASVGLTILDDVIEQPDEEFTFTLIENTGQIDSNYSVNPAVATDTVTLIDGQGGPGVGPTVGLSISETELEEGDTLTVDFTVDGEIPADGLQVVVTSPAPRALGEFVIFDENNNPAVELNGIAGFPEVYDGQGSSFLVTLTEPNASLTLDVFEDGPNEGPESFIFEVINGEEYEVASVATYDFSWTGQIAEFSVEGEFSYDASQSYEAGIVREEDLLSLDVSFFDPDGNLLRTYTDAQNKDLYPTVNFAFDTATGEILQDGTWDVDDNVDLGRNGFMLGEGNPDLRGEIGVQSGLAFWTRPSDDKLPHLHVDDWDDELGFPIGYSTHEDVSFPTLTVADLIDNGKVGETYLDQIQDRLDEFGQPVVATVSESGSVGEVELTINDGGEDAVFAVESGVTSVFLDLPLLEEAAGLTLVGIDSEATPFSDDFQVGFAITDDTDFTFAPAPFAPLGGTIEHSGTITLGLGGAEATIGEFSIGFDPNRVSETASGFFVADTLEDPLGLEIMFDLSAPGTAAVMNDEFEISGTDLLLAPELATALGLADLAGADVGDARVDALVTLDDGTPPTDGILEGTDGDDILEGADGNDIATALLGNDIVFGGDGDDRIRGDGGIDILSGDAGNDLVVGGPGDDVLMGVTGRDVIVGDSFFPSEGRDIFVYGNGDGTDTIVEFNPEFDRIGLVEGELTFADITLTQDGSSTLLGVASSGEVLAVLNGVQASALGENSFVIVPDVSNPEEAIELLENLTRSTILGTEGDDLLVGTEIDETINALEGNDVATGGLGNDIIQGGDGNDVLRGDLNDRDPQDDIDGGNDIIFGGEGNDRIGGKAGNDILSGDAGDDLIWGDDGDDILMGVTGNDILVGDNFSGGSGSDLFVFGLGDGTDTVLDFEVGIDRIGIVEGEFTFADVVLTQDGANTRLGVGSETLAVLNNVMASALDESSFEVVPDVSNPEEALALV